MQQAQLRAGRQGGSSSRTALWGLDARAWNVSAELGREASAGFELGPSSNPFSEQTTLVFNVPERETVTLRVYDVMGRRVKTLMDRRPLRAGTHKVTWNGQGSDGRALPSGVYFSVLEAEGTQRTTVKLTLDR